MMGCSDCPYPEIPCSEDCRETCEDECCKEKLKRFVEND